VQKYEQKGEKIVNLPEFSNLFITANSSCPLHTHPGDRRQVILEANTLHLQDRPFFKKLNDDFKTLDLGHAWYWFLKRRELGTWHPSEDPPTAAKSKTVEHCMVKSHSFINDFFCSSDWLLRGIPELTHWAGWTSKYQFSVADKGEHKGKYVLRIEAKRFFVLYKHYVRANYPASRARNIDTFFSETEKVGVVKRPKRRMVNSKKYHCVDVVHDVFKERMSKLYPHFQVHEWDSSEDPKAFMVDLEKKRSGGCPD
jgi:hypothetical protein